MKKLEIYTGTKAYMFPNGALATPTEIEKQFTAINHFPHVIETDDNGEVCFAVMNLSAMKSLHGIDKGLSQKESVEALEAIINAPQPESEPTAEERIAAAMEFQNLMIL